MKIRTKHLVILTLCGVVIAGAWATSTTQTQKIATPSAKTPRVHDKHRFPLLEFETYETQAVEPLRKKISSRYEGKQSFDIGPPHPQTTGVGLPAEGNQAEAIPLDAQLVVVGWVTHGRAYLTSNNKNIYSEFDVRVNEVLKADSERNIVVAESIVVDRVGGRIRFKNGQEVTYEIIGTSMPRVGKEYLLFLGKDGLSPNYRILTGYELDETEIEPLDIFAFDDLVKPRDSFLQHVREKLKRGGSNE